MLKRKISLLFLSFFFLYGCQNDWEKAKSMADRGDGVYQQSVGEAYLEGHYFEIPVQKNCVMAHHYLSKALANPSHPIGLYSTLAEYYFFGNECYEVNRYLGKKYARIAAEKSDLDMIILRYAELLYLDGELDEAERWAKNSGAIGKKLLNDIHNKRAALYQQQLLNSMMW